MKILRNIIFGLILTQFSFAQTGKIKGHIQDTIENEGLAYANILITELHRGTATDLNGDFTIDKIPPGTYNLKISTLGYLDKTIESIEIKSDTIIELNILYPPKCKYNHNNMTCPICNKKDEVIPILYGYPSDKMFRKADKGKIKLGGCVISGCDPKWYCKRDETEF